MTEDTIKRHAEAAEREINYTSAQQAFAGFGMGLIERSRTRTEIISKHIKAAVSELLSLQHDSICQTLGKALGFPWHKDDQVNFPGATEANGVCVGDHVAESLAEMAADHIEKQRGYIEDLLNRANRLQDRISELTPLIDAYGLECKAYGLAIQSLGSDEQYGLRKMRDETKAKIDSILKGTK